MGRIAKLICVTKQNNNKYYEMTEEESIIHVKFGRVGGGSQSATYPSSRWESLLKSKIKKGYMDVTGLRIEDESIDFDAISDDVINAFIAELQSYASHSIQQNYTVSSEAVTQKQIDKAQSLIDKLAKMASKKKQSLDAVNDMFLELFQVIPRKMKDVNDWLADSMEDFRKKVGKEQDTLDVMKGQVSLNSAKKQNTVEDKKTILEAMGLEMRVATDEETKAIKAELGDINGMFYRAFAVTNNKTQIAFDNYIAAANNKKTQQFWHGSRNENWMSIMDTGLVLRPTNAVITGKMFGYGLYFADKARKSLGYTSYHNSYWARGNSTNAFMSLYDVHLGNELKVRNWDSWMGQLTEEKLKARGKYDSLFAEGGADLRNNEYIVYDGSQCTIRYIVELR